MGRHTWSRSTFLQTQEAHCSHRAHKGPRRSDLSEGPLMERQGQERALPLRGMETEKVTGAGRENGN